MIVIAVILLINAAGILFRISDIDPYIILIGFRFHLSLTLPALIFISRKYRHKAFQLLKNPGKFKYSPLLLIFISGAVLYGGLYLPEFIKLTDPDYFYELGLSSIIDFPIYLLWNLPQFLITVVFIAVISSEKKAGFLIAWGVVLLLFAYKFIPLGEEEFKIIPAVRWIVLSLFMSLVIYKVRNVYLASCMIFLSVWMYLLLAGSSSQEMVNIFLGKYYESWEGFFAPVKKIQDYVFFLYIGIQLLVLMIGVGFGFLNKPKEVA